MTDSGTLKDLNDMSLVSGSYFRVAKFFRGFGKSIGHWWGASTVESPFASKFATLMRSSLAKTAFPIEIDHIVSEW